MFICKSITFSFWKLYFWLLGNCWCLILLDTVRYWYCWICWYRLCSILVQIWEKVPRSKLVSCSTWCWQQTTTNQPMSPYYHWLCLFKFCCSNHIGSMELCYIFVQGLFTWSEVCIFETFWKCSKQICGIELGLFVVIRYKNIWFFIFGTFHSFGSIKIECNGNSQEI